MRMPVRFRFGFLLAVLFLLFGVPSFVDFWADWLWFGEVGYQPLFLRILSLQAVLGGSDSSSSRACSRRTCSSRSGGSPPSSWW